MFSFEDKVVWVTGSSTGIGRAIAVKFAEYGASVIGHGNANKAEAERTWKEVRGKAGNSLLVIGDVTDRSQVDRMTTEIKNRVGRLDVLVNNGGSMVQRARIEGIE